MIFGYSTIVPLSRDPASPHVFWARPPPSAAIADGDDARHRDGIVTTIRV